MTRTAHNGRFHDRKDNGPQGRAPRTGRRDAQGRREGGGRRDSATVVHPWMSLPERLAVAQAAMRELAGTGAFTCPLGESLMPASALVHTGSLETASEAKPRNGGVSVIIRKRRLPAGMIPVLSGAG